MKQIFNEFLTLKMSGYTKLFTPSAYLAIIEAYPAYHHIKITGWIVAVFFVSWWFAPALTYLASIQSFVPSVN